MEREIPKKITINEPGIYVNYDLVWGSREYEPFGLVAQGYVKAPGKGRMVLQKIHDAMQQIAEEFGVRVTHLVEPMTADGKNFVHRIRQEGIYFQNEVYIGDTRFFIETFEPRIKR